MEFQPLYLLDKETENEDLKFRKEVLNDYWICLVSREASIIARREVLTGKAKFGITGDGKEVAQVAMAKAFKKGDFRSGYYRDQTLMFALGEASVEAYFAQLYADPENDPFSSGRQMMAHFATPFVDENGDWTRHTDRFNISSDVSCTAGQVGRALGLAVASKKYRNCPELKEGSFSENGNEVVFCTIGDGSTSEGSFWETVNAAAVMNVPLAINVWDDGYAISVPLEYQTVKKNISKALEGFLYEKDTNGIRIYTAKGWDYAALCDMYINAIEKIRSSHIPALFHIQEMTQPQGHSTSGSHERYKSKSRLQWEKEMDCIKIFGEWIVKNELATEKELLEIRDKARQYAKECRERAWKKYIEPIGVIRGELEELFRKYVSKYPIFKSYVKKLHSLVNPLKSDLLALARQAFYQLIPGNATDALILKDWITSWKNYLDKKYGLHLYVNGSKSALSVPVVKPVYTKDNTEINGFEILNRFFDKALKMDPRIIAFGEDVGRLGDVNQGLTGLQAKYGEERVFDTGIREWTIVGQAIGMAMRGLRPIAEIQYLDYMVFALAPLADDLATLHYRSAGLQIAPAIIRTRGHRLEGIWHSGSPMGMLIHALRGIYILVPRNMVQAVGLYNTMLKSNDPAIIIECLNAYRLKEKLPDNLELITVPLGIPEILIYGTDITIVTYGACVRIAEEAIRRLEHFDISVELIDIQTLVPFDLEMVILHSLKKTNRIIFLDEDVPGGATSYMMQKVIEEHGGFKYLEIAPKTITASAHRPPYGSDGDYFSKPNAEDIFESVYSMMHEIDPLSYPIPE